MTCTCGHDADSQHDDGKPWPCRECMCLGATDDPTPVETLLNGRWPLLLPPHRAYRPQWGWFEAVNLGHMHHYTRPGDIVYDVGSEEGDMSGLFAQWVAPTGGVVLAEPNPRVWPNVRAVWEANGLPAPLATVVGFIGDVDRPDAGWASQHVDASSTGAQLAWPSCAYGPVIHDHGFLNLRERHDVPVITLDSLVDRIGMPPTTVAIDVEGAELAVLRGATRTLAEHRPVVWLSLHPQFLPDYGATADDVYLLLWDAGYGTRFLAEDHEQHVVAYPRERAREFEL